MKEQEIEFIILGLTYVQMELVRKRKNHNGNVLKHDDIDKLQESIEVLKIIKMDLKN